MAPLAAPAPAPDPPFRPVTQAEPKERVFRESCESLARVLRERGLRVPPLLTFSSSWSLFFFIPILFASIFTQDPLAELGSNKKGAADFLVKEIHESTVMGPVAREAKKKNTTRHVKFTTTLHAIK